MKESIRLGIVDLDSSHPVSFLTTLKEFPEARVTTVFDSGDVRPAGYADRFAREHGIPKVSPSIEEMCAEVDGACLLGVNWDRHVERARPLLEAGIPVFIDKPVAGRLRDLYALHELAERTATPIMGGSGQRYSERIAALRDALPERGVLDSAMVSGPGTFYYYGIHTAEAIQTVLGSGIRKVTRCGRARELFEIEYKDGLPVWVRLETARPISFTVLLKNKPALTLSDPSQGRDNVHMFRAFLDMIRTRTPPFSFAHTIETTALQIALFHAKTRSESVYVEDLPLDEGPDGTAFAAWYADSDRP